MRDCTPVRRLLLTRRLRACVVAASCAQLCRARVAACKQQARGRKSEHRARGQTACIRGNAPQVHVGPGGHHQWRPKAKPGANTDEPLPNIMALTTDVALLHDPEYLDLVKLFASDSGALERAFGAGVCHVFVGFVCAGTFACGLRLHAVDTCACMCGQPEAQLRLLAALTLLRVLCCCTSCSAAAPCALLLQRGTSW